MKDAEQQLIIIMQQEVMQTVHGGGPGKPDWRREITRVLGEVYEQIANDYIEAGVGVPSDENIETIVKAMIVEQGSGSAVGRPPIHTKPGQLVWDDDMSGKHRSNAESVYDLPTAFNQQGNHFVENAMKRMKKHFQDVMSSAVGKIPDSVFFNNVVTKKR